MRYILLWLLFAGFAGAQDTGLRRLSHQEIVDLVEGGFVRGQGRICP